MGWGALGHVTGTADAYFSGLLRRATASPVTSERTLKLLGRRRRPQISHRAGGSRAGSGGTRAWPWGSTATNAGQSGREPSGRGGRGKLIGRQVPTKTLK